MPVLGWNGTFRVCLSREKFDFAFGNLKNASVKFLFRLPFFLWKMTDVLMSAVIKWKCGRDKSMFSVRAGQKTRAESVVTRPRCGDRLPARRFRGKVRKKDEYALLYVRHQKKLLFPGKKEAETRSGFHAFIFGWFSRMKNAWKFARCSVMIGWRNKVYEQTGHTPGDCPKTRKRS